MCGAAAVATVLNHLVIHVNQSQVCDGTDTTRQLGTPWKGIVKYVCKHRLRCTPTIESPDSGVLGLVRSRKYALLEWGDWPGHWVLVAGWEAPSGVLVLMDPCRRDFPFTGMLWNDFSAYWNGMKTANPRLVLSVQRPVDNAKSKKGLEERSDFRLVPWALVHKDKRSPSL